MVSIVVRVVFPVMTEGGRGGVPWWGAGGARDGNAAGFKPRPQRRLCLGGCERQIVTLTIA